jgi:hypothetical protein
MTGRCRKLHNDELLNHIKEDNIAGGACRTYGNEICTQNFSWENLKGKDHLGVTGEDEG